MKGKEKPNKSVRDLRANMAKIKAKKPTNGPLERPSAAQQVRARVRAPKPYLFVPNLPDPPPPENMSEQQQQSSLPKAEKLFKNHLFNQSKFSGW